MNPGDKFTRLAVQVNQISTCKEFDVQMPADLDQFG